MKLILTILLLCSLSTQAQQLPGFSLNQSNAVRALVKASVDSVRREFAAGDKSLLASLPVADGTYFRVVSGKLQPIRTISGDSLIVADKIEKTAFNAQLNSKANLADIAGINTSINTLSGRVSALEVWKGLTDNQLKVLADKLEAMRLTIPNGLTFPR